MQDRTAGSWVPQNLVRRKLQASCVSGANQLMGGSNHAEQYTHRCTGQTTELSPSTAFHHLDPQSKGRLRGSLPQASQHLSYGSTFRTPHMAFPVPESHCFRRVEGSSHDDPPDDQSWYQTPTRPHQPNASNPIQGKERNLKNRKAKHAHAS